MKHARKLTSLLLALVMVFAPGRHGSRRGGNYRPHGQHYCG